MEKYYNKISLFSRLLNFGFKFTNSKKNSISVDAAKKYIDKLSKKSNYTIPDRLGLTLENYKDMKVYTYNGSLKDKRKKLLYIHGGSYIEEAISFQIKFAMKIAKKTNSTLIFPVYPLAPNSNYKIMYKLMTNLYETITNTTENINFLGDSAGGGFVLSFAMYLRDNKMLMPQNIVMLSPWVDVSMENPDLYILEKHDYMCGVDGTRYEGELWADGLDLKNYLISPLYGNFNDLGKMTIITGSREILNSDCHILSNKLKKKKIDHNFIEYRGQGHDFGAYPTKEGNMVINDIATIINGGVI